jgi:glycosyltransferase involved in cell wall biosynthesis
MRVCVFNWKDTAHPEAGGAEVYTREVLTRWVRDGHEVTWFAGGFPGGAGEEWTADGVRIVRRGGRLSVYREARRWYAASGVGAFDLVIDEVNTKPFGCARWVRDTPVVALIHQVAKEIWNARFPPPASWAGRYWLEPRWLAGYRDVPVFTVSESSRESLRHYGLRHVEVLPEGIERRPRPDVPKEPELTLIALGRLAPVKQVDHAIAAFRAVCDRVPGARLWIVGDGPLRARLERDAPAGVVFFGRVPSQRRDELLAMAHVHVATALREGWALTVDEAAAMGTVTVGYDQPGLRDSVPAARGVLVEPRPDALAEAVLADLPRWTANPSPDGWSGGAADWDAVSAAALAACERVLGAGRRSAAIGRTRGAVHSDAHSDAHDDARGETCDETRGEVIGEKAAT